MIRWVTRPYQRRFRSRRSIIFPIVIFMLTTILLYTRVEYYTLTTNYINSSSLSSKITYDIQSTSINFICELKNDTIRAINQAPSDYCKEKIKNISCQIDSTPNFFPTSLPRFCPIRKGNFGDIIGCISNDDNSTYATNKLQVFNTDIMCIDHCLKLSVPFAEYNEFTNQCSCLSTFDNQRRLITSDRKCSDISIENDKLRKNLVTLYRTGYIDFGNHLEKRRHIQNSNETIIIFFLTVGGRRNLRQIKRLIRTIYLQQHYYLIHVDSNIIYFVLVQREKYLHQELIKLSENISNIHVTNRRYPTTWGASTLLTAHLEAFKQIFDELQWNFTFILNLSESDFPLKPIQVLTNFLSMYTSYNFLRTHNREPFKFIKSQGMFHTFIHCNNYMYRIGSRSLIQNIVYDGGSDWYVLNREFVHYITYGNDELINGLRHIFNYSLLPCETFFHTLLSNSIYCDTYIRNNLRRVHWNRQRGCKCQHKHVVDWCGCSPLVYRSIDKTILNDTIDKPIFFARKFDASIDETIIDWLDEKISRRDLSNSALYLQNIYHFNDDTNNLTNVLKLIDLYARTLLIDYQQYRRDCFRDDKFHLEQIHFIFQLSIFQGYSLQYKFNDGEQFELFIKLNSLTAQHSNQIKRFEVGLELDSKEIIFIDRSRTFIEPKVIKALIEWQNMTSNDTSLVIHNPNGAILQRVKLVPSNEPVIIDIFFPAESSPNLIGIWQMSIVKENQEDVLASLNFLVLLSNDEQFLNNQYLTIIKNFWSISNFCSVPIKSSLCQNLSDETIATKFEDIDNCFQQRSDSDDDDDDDCDSLPKKSSRYYFQPPLSPHPHYQHTRRRIPKRYSDIVGPSSTKNFLQQKDPIIQDKRTFLSSSQVNRSLINNRRRQSLKPIHETDYCFNTNRKKSREIKNHHNYHHEQPIKHNDALAHRMQAAMSTELMHSLDRNFVFGDRKQTKNHLLMTRSHSFNICTTWNKKSQRNSYQHLIPRVKISNFNFENFPTEEPTPDYDEHSEDFIIRTIQSDHRIDEEPDIDYNDSKPNLECEIDNKSSTNSDLGVSSSFIIPQTSTTNSDEQTLTPPKPPPLPNLNNNPKKFTFRCRTIADKLSSDHKLILKDEEEIKATELIQIFQELPIKSHYFHISKDDNLRKISQSHSSSTYSSLTQINNHETEITTLCAKPSVTDEQIHDCLSSSSPATSTGLDNEYEHHSSSSKIYNDYKKRTSLTSVSTNPIANHSIIIHPMHTRIGLRSSTSSSSTNEKLTDMTLSSKQMNVCVINQLNDHLSTRFRKQQQESYSNNTTDHISYDPPPEHMSENNIQSNLYDEPNDIPIINPSSIPPPPPPLPAGGFRPIQSSNNRSSIPQHISSTTMTLPREINNSDKRCSTGTSTISSNLSDSRILCELRENPLFTRAKQHLNIEPGSNGRRSGRRLIGSTSNLTNIVTPVRTTNETVSYLRLDNCSKTPLNKSVESNNKETIIMLPNELDAIIGKRTTSTNDINQIKSRSSIKSLTSTQYRQSELELIFQ
ncbi:unnamed protein product [Adineta steineri]|uniref:protein xylosyltransferase n=1 Tax=Adineta steineri TaxID=433720 RepID=A0A818S1D1_9BILA|nr:unnamed protein product [Adineta steineri]